MIGPEGVRFTFVGSYEELKGRKVSEVLDLVGQSLRSREHVSAIIFSASPEEYPIIPANARGLLQVISDVEQDNSANISHPLLPLGALSDRERSDLASRDEIGSWAFSAYRPYFRSYCEKAHVFRCSATYDVKRYISAINSDWHPIGAAVHYRESPCRSAEYCSIDAWDRIKERYFGDFGARIFFIPNVEIDKLHDRYLIDFENPTEQLIPEIGLRDAER